MNIQLKDVDNVVFNGIDISAVKFNNVLVWQKWETIEYTGGVPVTVTANGEPLLDYLISGNMNQSGTPSPQNVIFPEECGERTGNLAAPLSTWYDGYISATGELLEPTAAQQKASEYIAITGEQVTFSCVGGFPEGTGSDQYSSIAFYEADKTFISRIISYSGDAQTASVPNNAAYARLSCRTYGETKDVMFVSGSTPPSTYIPYGYKLDISSGGENLFDKNANIIWHNNVILNDSGNETSSNSSGYTNPFIEVESNTTYTLNGDLSQYSTGTAGGYRVYYYQDSTFISRSFIMNNSNNTFTTPQNCNKIALQCQIINGYPHLDTIMLNLGSTAKPYSPYNRTSTPIYLGEVPTTRRIKKLVLTGDESWYVGTENYYSFIENFGEGVPYSSVICTHAQHSTINNTGKALFMKISDFSPISSVADFKAYLAAQYAAGTPVTVWYILANETTGIVNEPIRKIGDYADSISAEQAQVQIPTVSGANVVDIDTTLKPSGIYLKYKGREYV